MNEQKLNAWFANFEHRFDKQVPDIIAETATEYFKERFIRKNWDNTPWRGYKNKKYEPSRGSLMMRSNLLFQSVRPAVVEPGRVRISAGSSKVPYARVHNEGLRVRAVQYVRPHKNNNFMGRQKRVNIKGHSRKIDFKMPRRQFMGHSAILNREIIKRLRTAFKSK